MPNKLSQFWQELKRRNVVRVITVYAGAAFVIIELINNITEPLRLPDWTPTFVIVLLAIGFPIVIIFSWIYDVNPEGGMVKTEPADKVKTVEKPASSNSWKIASYISFVVILAMVGIQFYPRIFNPDRLKEMRDEQGMISIAVMPFDNLTGNASLSFWQNGISEYLINRLGNSQELAVLNSQAIFDMLAGTPEVNKASLSPDLARQTARKINATTYITGNFIGKENDASIMLNLVNTGNGELIWSTSVTGDLGSDYRAVLDHLSEEVRNYMEIKALEQQVESDLANAYPNSSEAYRHYIEGLNAIIDGHYDPAIESLTEAYEIDSNFTFAAFYLAFAHCFSDRLDTNMLHWTVRAYELKKNLPAVYRPWIDVWYSCYVTMDADEIRKYCDIMFDAALQSRLLWFDLGVTYDDYLDDYDKAINAFQKVEELNLQWDDNWKYEQYYSRYSSVLLKAGLFEETERICRMGLEINPDNETLMINRASAYLIQGDSAAFNHSIEDFRIRVKEKDWSEAQKMHNIGDVYLIADDSLKAAEYYRSAYDLDSDRKISLISLINCELSNHNFEEGLSLSILGLTKWPDDVILNWQKGWCLHKLGRYEQALAVLKGIKGPVFHPGFKRSVQAVENALAQKE